MFNRLPGAMLSLGHTHQWRKGRSCSRVLSQHNAAIGPRIVTGCSIRRSRTQSFLDEFAKSFGRPPAGLTRRAREALLAYHWPGNVRELRNVLERAAILSEGALIDIDHLALDMSPAVSNPSAACTDLNVVERETIGRVMRECKGNKSLASKRLGLTRTQLYVRLQKHGIAAVST